ncbi:MAG: Tritrans,polycis-undecaprenyl-diphosphate synthase (GGDP specific) [Methanonatronarchaeales archaeon]|nr:Tritrans,polycis-undecaprenyl-diphosphate synthase (GGDP specific) [Methanonatronarchaeales archaeon]
MPPGTLLIGGRLSPDGLREAVDEARSAGVDEVLLRTEDPDVAEAGQELGVEVLEPGRREVAEAVAQFLGMVEAGEAEAGDTEALVFEAGGREVDAVMMAGERRLADAALWGSAYAEYFFVDELSRRAVAESIREFDERSRRFGR